MEHILATWYISVRVAHSPFVVNQRRSVGRHVDISLSPGTGLGSAFLGGKDLLCSSTCSRGEYAPLTILGIQVFCPLPAVARPLNQFRYFKLYTTGSQKCKCTNVNARHIYWAPLNPVTEALHAVELTFISVTYFKCQMSKIGPNPPSHTIWL